MESCSSRYIEEDKVAIATQYLIPRQISENGLSDGQISFSAVRSAKSFRLHSGSRVRQLEREIGTSAVAVALASRREPGKDLHPERDSVRAYLGPGEIFQRVALRTQHAAWLRAWRGRLSAETSYSSKRLKWPVMANSSYRSAWRCHEGKRSSRDEPVKSRRESWHCPEQFRKQDIHVHIPAGAIPRTAPVPASLYSLRSCRCFSTSACERLGHDRRDQLRGLVLPVGGHQEKVLGGQRAGITCVLLPAMNQRDLEEIPPSAWREFASSS